MNKEESRLNDTFVSSIMQKVQENYDKIIYEAKKECLQRELTAADEERFSLTATQNSTSPSHELKFDGKVVGHIEQKQFDSIDIIGTNYTIAIEYVPVR